MSLGVGSHNTAQVDALPSFVDSYRCCQRHGTTRRRGFDVCRENGCAVLPVNMVRAGEALFQPSHNDFKNSTRSDFWASVRLSPNSRS
jgi:hypothetical protein